jgi:ubiquinone/menaquinone biosynthesis C-methylase UbiE
MKNKKVKQHMFWVFILILFLSLPNLHARSRDDWQQPQKIFKAIGVKKGMHIGEPGAGRGYYTLKLARKVGPTGKIYANDIDEDVLDTLKYRVKSADLTNVKIIKGKPKDPLFPKNRLDMVFMSYVLHHISDQISFLENMKASLKPGATVVILAQDPAKSDDAIGHFMEKEEILAVMKDAGYRLIRTLDFLKKDTIYIYHLPM